MKPVLRMVNAALSIVWLRQHFAGQRDSVTDFVILISNVMQAWSLKREALRYLGNLAMATAADESWLYVHIMYKRLADERGMHCTIILKSTQRLAESDFISIRISKQKGSQL